ncbi:uncharacterized protein LOC111010847 [Momordica charantia]|uniref:Uncharacterized protein LOC111010847 n=1 Tax=Momordica charantia TaxID=3673 RepID=A0A6J1CEU4_MOMCH|nr:uncharacterized protein LOC111010847 [Momordica charantia]
MDAADISRIRALSSPELAHASTSHRQHPADHIFVGVATNVKLLLKLVHEHKDGSVKGNNGNGNGSRDQRISEMMQIIDEVKSQLQKCQCVGKRREAELRRCNTDLRRNVPREKKPNEPITDEKERLRRELNASRAARKSLESICSSIGKEKEIIAKELAKTVQRLHGMEEHVNDLKAQNEMLMTKVQACVAEHRVKKSNNVSVPDAQGNIEALQKRNKVLTEQLLKSLDAYRSLKRKLKDSQDKRQGANAKMEEMGVRVRAGLNRIHSFKEMINQNDEVDIEQEIAALEHMFKCFDFEISKQVRIKKQPDNKSQLPA